MIKKHAIFCGYGKVGFMFGYKTSTGEFLYRASAIRDVEPLVDSGCWSQYSEIVASEKFDSMHRAIFLNNMYPLNELGIKENIKVRYENVLPARYVTLCKKYIYLLNVMNMFQKVPIKTDAVLIVKDYNRKDKLYLKDNKLTDGYNVTYLAKLVNRKNPIVPYSEDTSIGELLKPYQNDFSVDYMKKHFANRINLNELLYIQ